MSESGTVRQVAVRVSMVALLLAIGTLCGKSQGQEAGGGTVAAPANAPALQGDELIAKMRGYDSRLDEMRKTFPDDNAVVKQLADEQRAFCDQAQPQIEQLLELKNKQIKDLQEKGAGADAPELVDLELDASLLGRWKNFEKIVGMWSIEGESPNLIFATFNADHTFFTVTEAAANMNGATMSGKWTLIDDHLSLEREGVTHDFKITWNPDHVSFTAAPDQTKGMPPGAMRPMVFRRTSGASPEETARLLVGAWHWRAIPAYTLTIDANGQYLAGDQNGSESGKWRFDAGRILLDTATSSHREDVGSKGEGRVLYVDKSLLVLLSQDEKGKDVIDDFLRGN